MVTRRVLRQLVIMTHRSRGPRFNTIIAFNDILHMYDCKIGQMLLSNHAAADPILPIFPAALK